MKTKIYISGQITGLAESVYKSLFEKAEKFLNSIKKVEAINPVKIIPFKSEDEPDWSDYMRADIIELCKCEAIYMLKNWKESKGAKIEHQLAIDLGLEVIYE